MANHKPKKYSVKKSSGVQSKELLKTLQKMLLEQAGSVAYVFTDERIENVHAPSIKDMKTIEVKSVLHVNLNKQSFYRNDKGDLKSPNDLVEMFETTKLDLGAKSFIIN